MAADIPTKEPLTIRTGDTIKWTKSIDDYKASDGWSLSYSFRGTGGTIDITSSADGGEVTGRDDIPSITSLICLFNDSSDLYVISSAKKYAVDCR